MRLAIRAYILIIGSYKLQGLVHLFEQDHLIDFDSGTDSNYHYLGAKEKMSVNIITYINSCIENIILKTAYKPSNSHRMTLR